MERIKHLLRTPLLIRDLLIKEKKAIYKEDKLTQARMLSKGFLTHSNVMYEINKRNYKFYLTDYQQTKTGKINGHHSYLLNNKVAFEQVFNNYVRIPKTLATILHGKLFSLENQINNVNDLLDYLEENKKVIIKPISGSKGRGIFTIKLEESNIFVNNEYITKVELEEKLKNLKEHFISEYIRQGEFSNKLYTQSINTIRIMTMIDPLSKEPFIPAAVQRIGTARSEPMDNFSQGGLNANINIETGVLGKAVSYPYNGKMEWHKNHPDNGSQIEGLVIPHWDEIKESILRVARSNSYINYVGWDVVLTDTGVMLLEGNSWPDIDLIQIHKPLLENNRVYEFYKYHKII